jgi:hypothetical protein
VSQVSKSKQKRMKIGAAQQVEIECANVEKANLVPEI